MKKLFVALSLIALVLVAGCKTTKPADKGPKILVYNTGSDPETWDPSHNSANDGGHIVNNTFEGLFRATADGQELAGATSYQVSSDLLTYTFNLRQDAKWSNGQPVTAHDYVFGWLRVIDHDNPSEYSFIMEPYIQGAAEYLAGTKTADQVGIKALNDYTLEVKLNNPTPYFLQLLSFYTYMPIYSGNKNLPDGWEKAPATAVNNGPFMFKEYVIGSHVLLEKNPYYYNKDQVKLDGVKFTIIDDANTALNAYNQKEIHVLDQVPIDQIATLLATNPDYTIQPQVGTYYFTFNMDDSLIGNPAGVNGYKVRRALTLAIDRTSIVQNVSRGGELPATSFVPPIMKYSDGTDCGGDYGISTTAKVAEAQQLLREAGYDTPAKLQELSSHLVLGYNIHQTDIHKNVSSAIQQMWKQNLGIEITLEAQEWNVFQESRRLGEYPIARSGWVGDYPDPNTMLDLFTSYSGNNDAQWRYVNGTGFEHDSVLNPANQAFDQAITNAMTASGTTRDNYLKTAERILVLDEAVVMPVYHYTIQNLVNSNLVEGVVRTQMGHWYFGDAEFK